MGGLFVILVNIVKLSFIITTVSSIEICSNEIKTGRKVILYRMPYSGESCGCSVKLVGGEENLGVTFQSNRNPAGCQYKLIFNLKTVTREYSCKQNYPYQTTFTMTPTDILYVYLINDMNNTSGFGFNLTVQARINGQQVNLTCRSPWTNPHITAETTPATRTSITQTTSTQISTNQTSPTQTSTTQTSTTQTSPTTGDNNIHYTSITGTSGEYESTDTTDRSKTTEESQNLNIPVIVGCTVGGVVLVCVVVVIVICFLKRRKQKGQTDQNLSDQNLTDGNLYSNNIYDNSSPTQHQNTVDRNSYSDCYDHIPNDSLQIRNKNQVVMMSNNNRDSLDNDDYSKYGESASEHYECVPDHLEHAPEPLEHVPEQLEHVPNTEVEYAVVQKKPKNNANQDKAFELNNSRNKRTVHDDYENVGKDNLNLKREINRIVGPKGDDYTLVNKC